MHYSSPNSGKLRKQSLKSFSVVGFFLFFGGFFGGSDEEPVLKTL